MTREFSNRMKLEKNTTRLCNEIYSSPARYWTRRAASPTKMRAKKALLLVSTLLQAIFLRDLQEIDIYRTRRPRK